MKCIKKDVECLRVDEEYGFCIGLCNGPLQLPPSGMIPYEEEKKCGVVNCKYCYLVENVFDDICICKITDKKHFCGDDCDAPMEKNPEEIEKGFKLVDNVEVFGLESSIKGSKYPMSIDPSTLTDQITDTVKKLGRCEKGTGHDQFLTGIVVNFDLTFSNKAWVEAERYTFLNFVSSMSTMHCINKFDIRKQCNEYVDEKIIEIVNDLSLKYKGNPSHENYLKLLYNIPSGFRLTARMTTNYRALKTIYSQRKNHRLPEWREFCRWIETLPYFRTLCLED